MKIQLKFHDCPASEERHFYYNEYWQCVEERDGSDAFSDALFNVVALTDNTGSVVERLAYQPYGQSEEFDPDFTPYSGTDYKWEYRFTGRELDLETGLQINRMRYLHLQLGRWVTSDPIGYRGGVNLYPTYFIPEGQDPYGLQKLPDPEDIDELFDFCFNESCANCLEDKSIQRRFGRLIRCKVNVYCSNSCGEGGGGPLGGLTFVHDNYIHICLNSNKLKGCRSVKNMLVHEEVHVNQYLAASKNQLCRQNSPAWQGPPPPTPQLHGAGNPTKELCGDCIKSEIPAYMAQAKDRYPNMPWLWNEFVNWGVCFSCAHVCTYMSTPCGSFAIPPELLPGGPIVA